MTLRKTPQVVSLPAGDSLRSVVVWWQVGAFRTAVITSYIQSRYGVKVFLQIHRRKFGFVGGFVVSALGLSPTLLGMLVKHSATELPPPQHSTSASLYDIAHAFYIVGMCCVLSKS